MRTRRTPYTTTLYLWNGVSAMFYSAYITPFHSHNAMQLVFDIGGNFRFRTRKTGWNHYKSLLIKENVIHQLDTSGSVQLIIYLEDSSDLANAIRSHYLADRDICSFDEEILFLLKPGQLERCLLRPDNRLLDQLVGQLLVRVKEGECTTYVDERVKQAMRLVAAEQSGEITINRLAESLFLSESRLRAIFRANTGISLHKYILLHKVNLAITGIMNGDNILEAAAGSGFSDSSHFHRVMLHLFGVSPSQFIKYNKRKRVERIISPPISISATP